MNSKLYLSLLFLTVFLNVSAQKNKLVYESEQLRIEQLTKNTFRHITYLPTEDFGKVSCNGMIVRDGQEAFIFDTPTNDTNAIELIDWVEKNLDSKIVGVIVTHFHNDCLGGLNIFHQRQIPSYASFRTIERTKSEGILSPQNGFENYFELPVGMTKITLEFPGEGHTSDNIVCYFPKERVLFGGCLVKCMGANKGYLGDANIYEWPTTVRAVKSRYPKVKVVIPGHGKPGKAKLLDYTIELFEEE